MPLWGKSNLKASAPKWEVIERKAPTEGAARGNNTAFNNTTPGAFGSRMAKGIFGANSTDVHASSRKDIPHTGWHEVRQGTGPVTSLTISAGGTGFANLATGVLGSAQAGGNGIFQVTTNSTGGITAVTIVNGGFGFINTGSLTIVAPANGIINVAIGGGSGYSNADTITFSNGAANGTATLTTNNTGGITAVTITNAGRGFPSNTGTVVTISTSGGTNGNVVVNALGGGSGQTLVGVFGGRAGRKHYECLVAGSITGSPPATLP